MASTSYSTGRTLPPHLAPPRALPTSSHGCYRIPSRICSLAIAHAQNPHTQFLSSHLPSPNWASIPPALLRTSCGLLLCFVFSNAHIISSASAATFGLPLPGIAHAQVDEQPEPARGNCATCIGVVDETLAACGAVLNCVSTFDDRPAFFIAPWEFPGKLPNALQQVERILAEEGGTIQEQGNRYIHVVFTDKEGTIDDVEFLFSNPSEDATVNIRAASRRISSKDYGRNQKRLAKIRQALTWEEVPVLRNRKRKLFFLESPWDTFGPEPPPAFDQKGSLEFVPD